MKGLKVILWICGVGFLISFIFMVLPWSAIERLYVFFGENPIPNIPTVNYFFRISCGLVSLIGVFFILLAQNPLKYRPFLNLGAYGMMACGLLCFVVGLIVGISPLFYVGDALFGLILGGILLILIARASKA